MNWAEWSPTIVSAIIGIFLYGKMSGKVEDHDRKFEQHDARFDAADDRFDKEINAVKARIGLGEIEIAKLQAWRDGYNAAINKHAD